MGFMVQWKSSTTRQPPKTKDELRLMLAETLAKGQGRSVLAGRSPPTRKLKKTDQGAAVDVDPDSLAQSGVHKGIADANSGQAHRTRDHRGAASGILSDRERECAAALHSANRAADEGAGPKIPS